MNRQHSWVDTIRFLLEIAYFVAYTAHAVLSVLSMLTG